MKRAKTITLSARVPAEIAEQVRAECHSRNRYPATWVADAIREKIARSEQAEAEAAATKIVRAAVVEFANQATNLLEECFARIGEALPAEAPPPAKQTDTQQVADWARNLKR